MEPAIISILIIAIVVMYVSMSKKQNKTVTHGLDRITDYTKGYKSKWMFTSNEKDAYNKIKAITDELGLFLFAKVRLFDLIEPKKEIDNRQAHQWKIQAKHVDFVICDKKLVARFIIELDDSSHDIQSREERDSFVDKVLTNCGYKVLHMRNIEPDKLKKELENAFLNNSVKGDNFD